MTHPQSPTIYTSIRSSCSLNEISISCGPESRSAVTSCRCAFLYCHSMTVIIWFTFAFTFITQNKVIVTVTLNTVLANTDAWRKCRFLWIFIIVYCDSLDFVDFLSVLAKFIILNVHVFVQLGDFQNVKLPLLYKCFPVNNVHLLRLVLALFVSSLLLTDLIDTLQLRQVLNVILHHFFVYNELGGKFCDSIRCINWQLPWLKELLNIWLWLPIIGNTLLAIFIIIGKSMNAQVSKFRKCRLVWNWSWYSFSYWSSPGYLLTSICYTAVLAQWTIFLFTWPLQKFGIKLPWLDMLFIEFQDFMDMRWSSHIILRLDCYMWHPVVL